VSATQNALNETRDAMIAIGSSGLSEANVKSAQTALKSLILNVYKDADTLLHNYQVLYKFN
jgi:hypothetical protein